MYSSKMDKEMSVEITVIVPIYNRAYCLNQCLDSIKNQTFENWECILMDDGSTDNSLAVCRKYAAEDTRFHVYHQSNQGVSTVRNKGLDMAQGRYVNFVDSDDYLDLDCLQKLYDALGDTDWVIGGLSLFMNGESFCQFCCEDMIVCPDIRYEKEFVHLEESAILCGPCCKLYKRSIIEKYRICFPAQFSYGEDTVFNYTYLLYVSSFRVLNKCLYNAIVTSGSLSATCGFDALTEIWKSRVVFYTNKQLMTKSVNSLVKRQYWDHLWGFIGNGVVNRHDSLSALERYRFARDAVRESDRVRMKGNPCFFWKVFILRNGVTTWLFFEFKYLLLPLLKRGTKNRSLC